jgi:hypothetical protein
MKAGTEPTGLRAHCERTEVVHEARILAAFGSSSVFGCSQTDDCTMLADVRVRQ